MMQTALDFNPPHLESPERLLTATLAWIDTNRAAWTMLVRWAHLDAETLRRVRVKRYLEDIRCSPLVESGRGIKVPNAMSASIGRILAAWYPHIANAIPTATSKLDGLIIPPRPVWADVPRLTVERGLEAAGEGHGNVPAASTRSAS